MRISFFFTGTGNGLLTGNITENCILAHGLLHRRVSLYLSEVESRVSTTCRNVFFFDQSYAKSKLSSFNGSCDFSPASRRSRVSALGSGSFFFTQTFYGQSV